MEGRSGRIGDITLALAGLVLGTVGAAGFGAWRAVSESDASSAERWSAFAEAMLFPGLLVIVVVTVIVWLGWKANIDG